MRTEAEVTARELEMACFHEAGHLVMLQMLGARADARVWPNPNYSPESDERAWRGQTMHYNEPGSGQGVMYPDDKHPTPEQVMNWRVFVGLAGLVAEEIRKAEFEPWEFEESLRDGMLAYDLSVSDAALIGDAWTESDVEETFLKLREQWDLVVMEAEWLASCSKESLCADGVT